MKLFYFCYNILHLGLSHELFQNDENTFEVIVKEWFRHAAQRLKRTETCIAGIVLTTSRSI